MLLVYLSLFEKYTKIHSNTFKYAQTLKTFTGNQIQSNTFITITYTKIQSNTLVTLKYTHIHLHTFIYTQKQSYTLITFTYSVCFWSGPEVRLAV